MSLNNNLAELGAISDLLEKLFKRLDQGNPDKELWDAKDIGYHMNVGHRQVLERYAPLPCFPKAIRVPVVGGGRGQPLWKPEEVRKWWDKYQSIN